MSGYLERLVARNAGTGVHGAMPARLDRTPRFPPPGLEPAGTRSRSADGRRPLTPPAERPRTIMAHRPAGPQRLEPASAPRDAGSSARPSREPAPPRERGGRPLPAPRHEPPPAPEPTTPSVDPVRMAAAAPSPESAPRPAAPPTPVTQPPEPTELPSLEISRAAPGLPIVRTEQQAGSHPEPRIEVHVGRVEIIRPRAPQPRPSTPPAPRRSESGLGSLAASRRYVDRLVR
jgi:hypothetical protein